MDAGFDSLSVYIIKDLDQLRAMAHPIRKAIVEVIGREPLTVAQIADKMGSNVTKLYYHVQELEKHGLVQVARTETKGNLVEKYYKRIAEFITPDKSLFLDTVDGSEIFAQSIISTLEANVFHIRKAVASGELKPETEPKFYLTAEYDRLTPDQVVQFSQKLKAVLEEFIALDQKNEDTDDPDATSGARLTLVFYPLGDTEILQKETGP